MTPLEVRAVADRFLESAASTHPSELSRLTASTLAVTELLSVAHAEVKALSALPRASWQTLEMREELSRLSNNSSALFHSNNINDSLVLLTELSQVKAAILEAVINDEGTEYDAGEGALLTAATERLDGALVNVAKFSIALEMKKLEESRSWGGGDYSSGGIDQNNMKIALGNAKEKLSAVMANLY